MSHIPYMRARAHNQRRAGGFGNPGFTFPTIGTDTFADSATQFTALPSITTSTPSTTSQENTQTTPTTTETTSETTTSTSTTSSSSSSESSSSETTTSISPSTTATGTVMHGAMTTYVTHVASASDIGLVATASPTPSASGALVAPIIGGVAGGILVIAALVFLVTYFMRRRNNEDEAIDFNPSAFRRSAMLLSDPPTHQDTINRGFNPPPMTERNPMYMGQQQYPQYQGYDQGYDHQGYENYDTSSPGVASPSSANPLVFEAPFSPGSPVYGEQQQQGWGTPAPVLTRNISAGSAHSAHSAGRVPTPRNSLPLPGAEREYMDLERASVTPFQATQYAEISQRLNTEVPKGLDSPSVENYIKENEPATPTAKNPFADAVIDDDEPPMGMDFPSPPSPARTNSSRYRVDSMPPTLPEIVVHSRGNSLSPEGTPVGAAFPSGQTVIMKSGVMDNSSQFPVTPSPMASSFGVNTPPADRAAFPAVAVPAPAVTQARPDAKKRPTVPSTVYDPEDAYGGM